MNRKVLFILICVILSATSFAFFGRKAPFVYQNPIRFQKAAGAFKDEVRDPCIIREGNKYYMIHTMYPFTHSTSRDPKQPDYNSSPGIRMYESEDLKNWKAISNENSGWLVKSSQLPDSSPYKHRFWAPEIHKIKGKFYLLFTASNWIKDGFNPTGNMNDLNAFIGVSDKITGPYKHITFISGGACDLSIMEDPTSGKVFAYIPGMDVFVQEIDLSAINRNQVKLVGERKRVVTATNGDIGLDWNYKYLEGPFAFSEGGKYYLFYAGLRKDGSTDTGYKSSDDYEYWSGLAVANDPMGPFKKIPAGKAFWGGHLTVFDRPDGSKWLCYRGEKLKETHGFLCIDPFYRKDQNGDLRFVAPSYGTPH